MSLLLKNISSLDISNLILIVVLLTLIVVFSCYLIYIYFKKKNKQKKEEESIEDLTNYKKKIEELYNKSEDQIKKEIVENYELFLDDQTNKKIEEIKNINEETINNAVAKILIDTMESTVSSYVEKTDDYVEIPEELKGRLIGKDGINIKLIERLTLCQPFINKNENCIRVSSFNSIRKEIAIRLIKKLVKLKSFDRTRIEKYFEVVTNEFDESCIKIGKKTVDNLKLENIDEGLYKYIGRLNYRTSFKQNVLLHSIECFHIAKKIARELNLNEELAGQCAFLHDIGKSNDFEENGDHVESGAKLANLYHLNDYVLNSIESHHDNKKETSIYSVITKISDKISASRPGVRNNSDQLSIERITELEKICLSMKEVKKAYVVRNGKEVIAILDTDKITTSRYNKIGKKIKEEILKNDKTNYWDIKVTIIYEKSYSI